MTVHLTPLPSADAIVDSQTAVMRKLSSPVRWYDIPLLSIVYFGGGDSRAFASRAAVVPSLLALGLTNMCVSAVSSYCLAYALIGFFSLAPSAADEVWYGVAIYGFVVSNVNAALFHSQFASRGLGLLSRFQTSASMRKMRSSRALLFILRILIALFFVTSLAVPIKLNLTKADQTTEIANEQARRTASQSRGARESVDDQIKMAESAVAPMRDSIARLISERSAIQTGRAGGTVPKSADSPATSAARSEVLSTARQFAEQQRLLHEKTDDRDSELSIAQKHGENASELRRRRRSAEANAEESQRNAAQDRAKLLTQEIADLAAAAGKNSMQLDIYDREIGEQLGQLKHSLGEEESRLSDLETNRQELIAQRTHAAEGFTELSTGIIGRVESLERMVSRSMAALGTVVVIALVLMVWDLLPLLMKLSVTVDQYSMRVAREAYEALVFEMNLVTEAEVTLSDALDRVDAVVTEEAKRQWLRQAAQRETCPFSWRVIFGQLADSLCQRRARSAS